MARRTANHEVEFGSDAFLDVICNMVGILIIFVVVSGIQAGKAPVDPGEIAPAVSVVAPQVEEAPAAIEPLPLPPKPIALSPELLSQHRALETQIAKLHQSKAELESSFNDVSGQEQQARVQVEAVDAQLSAERAAAQNRRHNLDELVGTLEESNQQLGQLQQAIREIEKKKSPVTTFKHKVTPISREVNAKEVHFRLLKNRVALVPIDELVARLKPQIEQKKDMLIKFRQQEGEVGPVGGFSLRYVVEREPLPTGDAFGSGRGMVRISVAKWEIVPEPELQTETLEQAAQGRSNYARTLRMSDVNAVVTFWVYPDSFEIYRKLRDLAYEEGFTVAARPIPFDVPIAGSPKGSRSSGQ